MLNKIQLIGNLVKDPEERTTHSGDSVCNFTVATNEKWTNKDGVKQELVEYHNIVVFGKLADICGKWLKKGKQVYVEGKLRTESYEKDGVKKYATKVIAHEVLMLGHAVKADHAVNVEPDMEF